MPILGIMASQISGHLWSPEGAYDALATVTITTNTNSIVFAGIPTGYKHLQIRQITSSTSSGGYIDQYLRLNGDTGNNYTLHVLNGDGSSATGAASTSQPYWRYSDSADGTSIFGAAVVDILDYTNTNKNKTMRSLGGWDQNGTGQIALRSGLWSNTAAITSITLICGTAGAYFFKPNSQFALYGVK
jgi:hypothetical protein